MLKQLEEMKKRVGKEHHEVISYTQHVIDTLDQLYEEHMRLVGANALSGLSANGAEERTFQEDIIKFKQILYSNLEKTVQDLEHNGDKNWNKNFKDGVE
jgi:hypothetical protein